MRINWAQFSFCQLHHNRKKKKKNAENENFLNFYLTFLLLFQAPVALYSGKYKNTEESQFYFYNIKEHQWESLPRFCNLPHLASFITIDSNLYAAGGIHLNYVYWPHYESDDGDRNADDSDEERRIERIDTECTNEFWVYDVVQNSWESLPPMITARHNFPLLLLDGCIYAIGGEDKHELKMTLVERYDMAKKEWESVASLPERFKLAAAMVYEGKILAFGESPRLGAHAFCFAHQYVVYDPSKNEWKMSHSSESIGICFGSDSSAATSVLFHHNGTCYEVTYYPLDDDILAYVEMPLPYVRPLNIGEGAATVDRGEEMEGYNFDINKVGAFQIKDEIFLNVRGFLFNPNIKVTPEQLEEQEKIDLEKWENLFGLLENGNSSMIVNYTFDPKKLGPLQKTDGNILKSYLMYM